MTALSSAINFNLFQELSGALANNNYEHEKQRMETVYRNIGRNGMFNYYVHVTPTQAGEGLNNVSDILRTLPSDFMMRPGENPNTSTFVNTDADALPRGSGILKKADQSKFKPKFTKRQKAKGEGHYKQIFSNIVVGEGTQGLKQGLQRMKTERGYVPEFFKGELEDLHRHRKVLELYNHSDKHAGVRQKHPAHVGSVDMSKADVEAH